ncbi:nuclear pore complex component [Blumeria hordei DH14]|uniref:Nuclear pore complex component n=1 Tax=Blumeria graminis f. sp. hordei (strain DH14) TaxID=546991 RepID=N1JIL4_BLUG1|nr:nuclear pore complex component [Blumeria hordei DH14]
MDNPQPSTPSGVNSHSTPHTGTWQHPRLDEIVRRQDATSFQKQNIKKIMYNIGGIVAIYYLGRKLNSTLPLIIQNNLSINQYAKYLLYFLQSIFFYNIVTACLPLFRQTDNLADIPLTPAQRKLLGLSPLATPPKFNPEFSTPPRYARTSTPLSRSPIHRERNTGISTVERDNVISGGTSGSQFSPLGRLSSSLNSNRRSSTGFSSFGPGFNISQEIPGSPTPSHLKGSVPLNNKWLYDRGRKNSGPPTRLYT